MIPRSRLVAIFAVLVALATHAAAMLDFGTTKEALIEGGGEVAVTAALGNSFRDMTAGSTPSVEAETAEPVKPDVVKAETAEPVHQTPPEPVIQPTQTAQATPVETPPVQTSDTLTAVVQAPAPDRIAALALAVPMAPKSEPLKQPEKATPKTEVAKPKVTKAEPPKQAAKPLRDEPKKAKPIKEKPKKAEQKPKAKEKKRAAAAPAGNSKQNERKGSATGTSKKKTAKASSKGGSAKKQGNAAASNYKGLVYRKINRAKRSRDRMKGDVRVRLKISPSGALAAVSISKSSGSARSDKIALATVRRAAPFPKPPSGINLTFSVKLKGK